jgi:hypothetical protein
MSELNFAEWDSIMDELLPGELGDDEDQDKDERYEEDQDVKAENWRETSNLRIIITTKSTIPSRRLDSDYKSIYDIKIQSPKNNASPESDLLWIENTHNK